MATLNLTFRAKNLTGPEFDQLQAELQETARRFKSAEVSADSFSREGKDGISKLRDEIRDAQGDFGQLAVGAGIISGGLVLLGTSSISAAVEFDKLKRSLAAVTGSTEEAERQFARLQKVAAAPGLGLQEAVRGSLQLQGSLRQLGLGAEFAEQTVAALGNAVARSGGDRVELERAIKAIADIGAKGALSAEEIRIQLGGAVLETGAVLHDVFGTQSVEEIRNSGISIRDFLTRLIGGFEALAPVADSASNQIENFTDATTRAQASIGNVLLPTFSKMLSAITAVTDGIANLSETQREIIVWGGVSVAAITGITAVLAGVVAIIPSVVGGVRLLATTFTFLTASMGPVGLAATAISVSLVALGAIFLGIKKNIDAARFSMEDFTATIEAGNKAEIAVNIDKAQRQIASLESEISDFQRGITAIEAGIEVQQERADRTESVPLRRSITRNIETRRSEIESRRTEIETRQRRIDELEQIIQRGESRLEPQPVTEPTAPTITPTIAPPDTKAFDAALRETERAARQSASLIENEFDRARQVANIEAEFTGRRLGADIDAIELKLAAPDVTPEVTAQLEAQRRALQSQLDNVPLIHRQTLTEIETRETNEQIETQRRINEEIFRTSQEVQEETRRRERSERVEIQRTESTRIDAARRSVSLIEDRFNRERAEVNLNTQIATEAINRQLQETEISTERRRLLETQLTLIRQQEIAQLGEISQRETDAEIQRTEQRTAAELQAIAQRREARQAELNEQRERRRQVDQEERDAQENRVKAIIAGITSLQSIPPTAIEIEIIRRERIERDFRATAQPIAEAVAALPFDFIGEFAERRRLASRLQDDLARLEEDRQQRIADINASEELSVAQKARRIESIERQSAERRRRIEQDLADAKSGIFESVVTDFVGSLARMVAAAAQERIAGALVDFGVNALSQQFGGGQTQTQPTQGRGALGTLLDVGLGAGFGFLTGGPAGAAVGAGGVIAERAFDDPRNDRLALEVGRRSASNFHEVFFHDRKSTQDMVELHTRGFTEELSRQQPATASTPPAQAASQAETMLTATIPVNIVVNNAKPGDNEIKHIFREQVRLSKQGRG